MNSTLSLVHELCKECFNATVPSWNHYAMRFLVQKLAAFVFVIEFLNEKHVLRGINFLDALLHVKPATQSCAHTRVLTDEQ